MEETRAMRAKLDDRGIFYTKVDSSSKNYSNVHVTSFVVGNATISYTEVYNEGDETDPMLELVYHVDHEEALGIIERAVGRLGERG